MTPTLRAAGAPSPLDLGTHDDRGLAPPIEFNLAEAGEPELEPQPLDLLGSVGLDAFVLDEKAPGWMATAAKAIRPLCVGALMAIPTVGAATVGAVALLSGDAADRMVRASTAFLNGIPVEITVLIGTLASGYGFARTFEKVRSKR